jgi:hypothetical protein
MRTAVVADLHLGSPTSVLATASGRERLVGELARADRVVLLGDTLSLRGRPLGDALSAAQPFFDALGEALGERALVIVPGNHDHRLAELLADDSSLSGDSLARSRPWSGENGLLGSLCRSFDRADVTISYPGVWIRPDVYATHGHYLDCHVLMPRVDSVMSRVMPAIAARVPARVASPADYEALLAPLYAFLYARAQTANQTATNLPPAVRLLHAAKARVWGYAEGNGRPRLAAAGALAMAGAAAGPAAVLRRAVPPRLATAALGGMAEVVSRLEIRADHVIFGHTHRPGPLEGEEDEWRAPGGARLHNPGSWAYASILIGNAGERDPYWPGRVLIVESEGAPTLGPVLPDRDTVLGAA